MRESLKQALDDWKQMRTLTLDLLEIIPEKHLSFSVGENMGTIGKQYRHIGDVQICYAQAITSGKIDFDNYKRDYSLENSKTKLKNFLSEIDKEMLEFITQNQDAEIDWFGEKWSLEKHIRSLIEHEILHQGELVVYARILDLDFPESWELWGL